MRKDSKANVHYLTHSLKKIGRSVGRRSRAGIARQCMKDAKIKSSVIQLTVKTIKKEIKAMCAYKNGSLLLDRSSYGLSSFNWDNLIEELKRHAPTLFEILHGCVTRKKPKNSRSYRVKDEGVIGICAAILLRHQNHHMNLVQRILSLLLYSGHAPKMVCHL